MNKNTTNKKGTIKLTYEELHKFAQRIDWFLDENTKKITEEFWNEKKGGDKK